METSSSFFVPWKVADNVFWARGARGHKTPGSMIWGGPTEMPGGNEEKRVGRIIRLILINRIIDQQRGSARLRISWCFMWLYMVVSWQEQRNMRMYCRMMGRSAWCWGFIRPGEWWVWWFFEYPGFSLGKSPMDHYPYPYRNVPKFESFSPRQGKRQHLRLLPDRHWAMN